MSILITGGAGYIGSHTVLYFRDQGEDVIVLDNLEKGHEQALLGTTFYKGSIQDEALLSQIFKKHTIEAVIHFAASSLVGESVAKPLDYYENNVLGTQKLVKQMINHDVKQIVFSSTAATYGEPKNIPIQETDPTNPTSPYGETKLAIEKLFQWCDEAYGLKSICLRYFNAAGADPQGRIGEDHTPESHLIPIVLQVALGQRKNVQIFGDDYQTKDGSCVRDYIHVIDLAAAHFLALQKLRQDPKTAIYNLGNGKGFTVKEVIETCRVVTSHPIPTVVSDRRAGDPATLIASAELAASELGWKPNYPELETIVQHAWKWHESNPTGYNKK
ncbi:UDP-glucose 4-epimerase GalE [Halalkalibacter akibai]|uniref:UDP-glucose 4-epimerase n=1 Tax=Halalkalibacter akibai (strain ATCC 43226 / DSM 21942 / CIP 109018 / JCM 9157 / 1139) TaxID=1236973 RepID=W4QUF9_HALA3|nr:UDP-glucose 4-epimerase GalE [Halalkalibacter akibai]GAE35253.1 UDP-glucose 4-epimerase [Halalkalibacter akibai JCM 9157]